MSLQHDECSRDSRGTELEDVTRISVTGEILHMQQTKKLSHRLVSLQPACLPDDSPHLKPSMVLGMLLRSAAAFSCSS